MKKKSYLLLFLTLQGISLLAQQANIVPRFQDTRHLSKGTGEPRSISAASSGSINSFWINYGWIEDSLKGGLSVLNENYLFPDSTVQVQFGTSWGPPWIHCISDVLDVTDPDFATYKGFHFNPFTVYSIDSLSIEYAYERHSASTVTDTLIVHLFSNSVSANLRTGHWTGASGWNQNFNVDTLAVKIPVYDHVSNGPIATGMQEFKVLLGAHDTANAFLAFKALKTNSFVVPAGDLACTTVSFKPGYVYHTGDTLAKKGQNIFSFASYEENGANTFPSYKKGYWNSSGIIPTSVRYNHDALGWDSSYVPTYLYTAPFDVERHQIYYKVTSLNTGIQEQGPVAANELLQNRPNPFAGTTVINYQLNAPSRIRFEVYDIAGRKVLDLDEGTRPGGLHSLTMDGTGLKEGVYFYSMLINGQAIQTKKMVVFNR
jgi:hypothetical protein